MTAIIKTCIVCKEEKPYKSFAITTNHRDKCRVCHLAIVRANKETLDREKKARAEAYSTGEMPKAKRKSAYSNNGARRKIEDILAQRAIDAEFS